MSYPHHRYRRDRWRDCQDPKIGGDQDDEKLLEAARTLKGRKTLAEKTGFCEKQLLSWANVADRMRVKGISKEYAELLHHAGVDTVKELKYRNPCNLANGDGRSQQEAQTGPISAVARKWSNAGSSTPRNCR